ncbi:hypothetical protein DVZ84_29130 [Streptomyces parvulus]|uniref:Uncharacterized protein n=1 Tax=Streptomyces parvulus TaxID=146923 RepID=A0A369UYP7_9ACTN|nr:hypothetical protein DVZ84_29130 [Streptomyces parvulus]
MTPRLRKVRASGERFGIFQRNVRALRHTAVFRPRRAGVGDPAEGRTRAGPPRCGWWARLPASPWCGRRRPARHG